MNPIKDIIDGIISSIKDFFTDTFNGVSKQILDWMYSTFDLAIKAVTEQVSQTPHGFSPKLLETIKSISESAILPVAGLILTYIFCYEIYQMVTERNRGGNEVGFGEMLWLIIKTAIGIKLVTNAFTITLAIFDLGKWITDKIPQASLEMPPNIAESLLKASDDPGKAIALMLLAFLALVVTGVMVAIIFLVAWSRIIMIYLYVAVAPIPFATFLNKDWVGTIAQNYIKNLIALMLQGFFMMLCLVIYAGLLDKTSQMIVSAKDNTFYAVVMLLVSMGVLVLSLTKTHSYAKSVVGAI